MSRRTFGAVIAGGAMTARAVAAVEAKSGEVAALYKRAVVIDALANPGSMNVSWPPRGPLSEKQRDAIAASGITAINVTVSGDTFEASTRTIALWTGEADRYPTLLSIVRRHADIARAKADGTLGLILGFQNTEMLERDPSRLDVFHRLGVRIIQLTYNDRNLVGDGCLEPGDAGLSAYGRQVVERMNSLGIAVDLSHCGTPTTADGIAASTKPPLITHSGCREVYRHPRSKEDRELRAMADKGGVVGIYFMPFIGAGDGPPTIEMLMRQIDHALKVCGADHVGIGSDLSTTPIEETPDNWPRQVVCRGPGAAGCVRARRGEGALYPRVESPAPHRRRRARHGIAWPLDHGHRKGHRWQLPPRVEGHLDRASRARRL